MTKKEIQKALSKLQKEYGKIKYPLDDRQEIEHIFYNLHEYIDLIFEVCLHGNSSSDWWLQCEYYSDKICKSIIFDYDFNDNFENKNELIDTIIKTEKAILAFEEKLCVVPF